MTDEQQVPEFEMFQMIRNMGTMMMIWGILKKTGVPMTVSEIAGYMEDNQKTLLAVGFSQEVSEQQIREWCETLCRNPIAWAERIDGNPVKYKYKPKPEGEEVATG